MELTMEIISRICSLYGVGAEAIVWGGDPCTLVSIGAAYADIRKADGNYTTVGLESLKLQLRSTVTMTDEEKTELLYLGQPSFYSVDNEIKWAEVPKKDRFANEPVFHFTVYRETQYVGQSILSIGQINSAQVVWLLNKRFAIPLMGGKNAVELGMADYIVPRNADVPSVEKNIA